LDDATAALDTETTREILGSLRTAALGRTTLMVTHQPALLRQADRILVLDRGRIVQSGTHLELSAVSGLYRELLRVHDSASAETWTMIARAEQVG
jgi:ABC-type multidrug transport system fused ATPase/permease subunit